MKEKYDQIDEEKKKQQEEQIKKFQAVNSNFRRVIKMTEPSYIIGLGLIFSMCLGTVMPTFGIILTKLLFGLNASTHTMDEVRSNADFYCLMMTVCAVTSATFIFM